VALTPFHRLILPADANHHGTLYADTILRLALEAGYATAWKHVGTQANLVWPVYKWLGAAQVPDFVWVSIAAVILLSIH
jgi:hypothetical protein